MLVMRRSMKKDFTLTERVMHVTHCDNIGNNVRDMKENMFHFSRKSAAFTLAEVLITLGIIGVVAAITLPTLINETQRKQDGVKIKKFYSVMQHQMQHCMQHNIGCTYRDFLSEYYFLEFYNQNRLCR